MRIFKRLLSAISVLLVVMAFMPLPVHAIANPDNIDFGSGRQYYWVFENVAETGDMWFVAEGFIDYAVPPTDYTADEAFLFEVLTAGGTIITSTPVNEYGDRPISIYKTAAQVTTLGLVGGTAYQLRITGNPLVFASPAGNTITVSLSPTDYVDQSLATADLNPLRIACIKMVKSIELNDAPADPYWISSSGIEYLTTDGADIFLEGMPGLNVVCPSVFQSVVEPMQGDTPESYGAGGTSMNVAVKWGTSVGTALTNLGTYIGVTQALAGSIILFLIALMFGVYIYAKTESGAAVLLLLATVPFIGSWLGLLSLALAFIFAMIIVLLLGFFFFRSAM